MDAATVEATPATPVEGSAAVKATTTTAMRAAAACSLCERRACARHGQGRQRANYNPTHFPSCHDSSPSFL
jgi:hypothetical protein